MAPDSPRQATMGRARRAALEIHWKGCRGSKPDATLLQELGALDGDLPPPSADRRHRPPPRPRFWLVHNAPESLLRSYREPHLDPWDFGGVLSASPSILSRLSAGLMLCSAVAGCGGTAAVKQV